MARNLLILLDGTWNKRESTTNVYRTRTLIDDWNASQLVYYQQGVGTAPYERFRGGTFGMGVSDQVLSAYLWLTENYLPEDDIFLFGFSRGAFAVRALVGMV